MGEHLPKAPLREAILEIKWNLDDRGSAPAEVAHDRAYPLFSGILFQLIRGTYPIIERLPTSEIPDEITPWIVKQRFRATQNGWPVIQVGPGIATVNFSTQYSWPEFSSSAIRLFRELDVSYRAANDDSPPELKSLTLQYINALPRAEAREDILSFLAGKLHTNIQLPNDIPGDAEKPPTGIDLRVRYSLNSLSGFGSIRIMTGQVNDEPGLLWGITIDSGSDLPQDHDDFARWLEQAHDVAGNWFYNLVKGELLEMFRK